MHNRRLMRLALPTTQALTESMQLPEVGAYDCYGCHKLPFYARWADPASKAYCERCVLESASLLRTRARRCAK